MVRRARPEDARSIGDVFVAARGEMAYLLRAAVRRRLSRLQKVTDGRDNMEREPDALYEWRP